MAVIEIPGGGIGYDEAGEGPAVVLLHGALGDRRMWDHQFRALSHSYRVIRYDWRGYGESSDPDGKVAHFEDLVAVLDALDVPDAVLVGCSFGGAHCLEATLHASERVRGLVLVCSGLTDRQFPEEERAEIRRRIAEVIPLERLAAYGSRTAGPIDPRDVAAMAEMNIRYMVVGPGREPEALEPEVWEFSLQMCREMFAREWSMPAYETRYLTPPASGRLPEVRVPALVVNGLADSPDIQAIADVLTTGIPGARRLDLKDTGHMPSLERPEELTAALLDFLSSLEV